MVVARLKPDGTFCYKSINVTHRQIHDIRSDRDILNELKHLSDWERDYLIYGIIPKEKMTAEEYFKGFNFKEHTKNQNPL